MGIPTTEAKAEIETYPLIAKTKISDCSIAFTAIVTMFFLLVII